MTRVPLTFLSVVTLSACLTGPPGATPAPEPDPRVAEGDSQLFLCSTSAFEGEDFAPVALRIRDHLQEDDPYVVSMTLGAAHPDQDGVLAEPTERWEEEAYVNIGDPDALLIEGAGLSVTTSRAPGFPERAMFTGTLEHEDFGEHAVACWFDDFEAEHRYVDGLCRNAEGEWGWNPYPLPYTRDTGDGHCGDFGGVMLNEDFYGYPTWIGMDLQGAHLGGAQLFFAHILDASLEGADLAALEFGYAFVTGSVDEHTTLPDQGSCELDADRVDCMR